MKSVLDNEADNNNPPVVSQEDSQNVKKKTKLQLEPLDETRRQKKPLVAEQEMRVEQNPVQQADKPQDNIPIQSNRGKDDYQAIQSTANRDEKVRKKILKKKRFTKDQILVQSFLKSKECSLFIISLVGLYTILIFVIVALEDLLDDAQLEEASGVLAWVELSILTTFLIEILSNVFAYGVEKYFKDRWLFLDAIIILLSIIFVLIELSSNSISQAKKFISVIQAIFRFLRIFLLIRKAQTFKRIKNVGSIQTPAEKILEYLIELKELTDDIDTQLDIDYCIDKISSNQLYEAAFLLDDNQDAADWMKYGKTVVQEASSGTDSRDIVKNVSMWNLAKVPKPVLDILNSQHDDLYINPFELHASPQGKDGVVSLMIYLFATNDLAEVLNTTIDCFANYFTKIWSGYQDNPYHNKIHSFDVAQTSNFFVNKCKFRELADLTKLDQCCLYISAAIHDYNHPQYRITIKQQKGDSIIYIWQTQTRIQPLSTMVKQLKNYFLNQDKSVLEAYHVSASFQIMADNPALNIFATLTRENYKKVRESIIGMVLATDMAGHFAEIAKLKSRLGAPDFDLKAKDKQICMETIIHACDISNPVKGFDVYREWTERLFQEFWHQGDLELAADLPISLMCDRYTTNIAKGQAGFQLRFIDFVVRPMMSLITQFLPDFQQYYLNLDVNKAKWAELVEEFQLKLDKLNQNRLTFKPDEQKA